MARHDVLCHIINDRKLLLLKKSAELFGGGKWNGLGGKVGLSETPEEACIREVYEESGLLVKDLRFHGALTFWFANEDESIIVHVFSTDSFDGRLREGREGILRWTDFDKIPYEEMWADDRHWLPLMLKGKSFEGEFHFNQKGTRLLKYKLESS